MTTPIDPRLIPPPARSVPPPPPPPGGYTVGRCGDRSPTITGVNLPPNMCALPHGHAGWHRGDNGAEWSRSDDTLPALLAAIDNALRNGSHMTGANLAFEMLCDRLGVDRDRLTFRPDWATAIPAGRG